jgi:hypothetical protein
MSLNCLIKRKEIQPVKNTTFTFNGKRINVNMFTTDTEIDLIVTKLRRKEAQRQEALRREEQRFVQQYVSKNVK